MLKMSTNNHDVITNLRSLKKIDNINFVFEDGGQLFSSNLKDTVKLIMKVLDEEGKSNAN